MEDTTQDQTNGTPIYSIAHGAQIVCQGLSEIGEVDQDETTELYQRVKADLAYYGAMIPAPGSAS